MTTHAKGSSVTKTVSMKPDMGKSADERATSRGFRSFSAYVQSLIRSDLISGGDMILRETPASYGKKKVSPKAPSE
jgi:hypothetical protein